MKTEFYYYFSVSSRKEKVTEVENGIKEPKVKLCRSNFYSGHT